MKTTNFLGVGVKFILRFFQNKLGFYKPYFAQWELTYRCNLKCIFCNVYKNKTYHGRELSTEDSLKLLDSLKKAGVLFINFTGGEPFLKKDFVKILRYAKELGFVITMNENGILLKKHVPLIKDYIDSLHISLDSYKKDTYERLRGVKNTFSKVLEGIREAKKHGIYVAVNMTITNENFHEMENFCKFAEKLGVDVFLTIISIIPTEFIDSSQSKDIVVDFKKYTRKVKQLKKKYKFIKTSDAYLNFVESGGFNNYKCLAMKTSLNIKPDGSIVLPCGYFPRFKFHGDINQLKKLPSFKNATKICTYEFCKDCTLSCFFIPTSLLDINMLWSILTSYAFDMVS